jgi:hypothetical protein
MPRIIIGDPPSFVILPPHIRVVAVMDEASVVVIAGAVPDVLNVEVVL